MTSPALPEGWHSITPRIVTDDVAGLVHFMRDAFGATGALEAERPSVLRIDDSVVMISATGPRPATPAFLYVYVADADTVHARAVRAGARTLEEPLDTPYGERRAMIEDRWGNVWQIATPSGTARTPREALDLALRPIGRVRSTLTDRADAPRQGDEGAPDAWIDIEPAFADAVAGVAVNDALVVITWFHRAHRGTLQVHPRGEAANPLTGVFATRSPDRPNPLGLHRVTVRAVEGRRVKVGPIEAIDGTPVVDLKPVILKDDGE